MNRIQKNEVSRYFFIAFFLVVIVLSIAVIFPYRTAILSSMVLAYIFYPVYRWLRHKTGKKEASAFIVSAIIILIVIMPLSFVSYQMSKEAEVGYVVIKQVVLNKSVFEEGCDNFLCNGWLYIKSFASKPEIKYYIEAGLDKVSSYIAQRTFDFIVNLPEKIISVLLTLFFLFFFFVDGKGLVATLEKKVPLGKRYKEGIMNQVHEVIHAIVYGFFVIAVAEGAIATITFWIFGVSAPILWGLVIAFTAFIPFIGAGFVWVPAMIFKIMGGEIGSAAGILVGGLVIFYIDTFLKPRIIGVRADIHPSVILLGLLGGLKLIGFAGVIIGPIILSLLVMIIEKSRNVK